MSYYRYILNPFYNSVLSVKTSATNFIYNYNFGIYALNFFVFSLHYLTTAFPYLQISLCLSQNFDYVIDVWFSQEFSLLGFAFLLPLNRKTKYVPLGFLFLLLPFLFANISLGIKILALISINFILYLLMFNGRRIALTLRDAAATIINLLILWSFSYGLVLLFKKPNIFLPDLTPFAQIRYIILLLISIICIFVFLLSQLYPLEKFISLVSYPYLKESMRIFLYTFKPSFEDIFSNLMDSLYNYKKTRYIYYCIYIFFFLLIPLLQTICLINFTFFNGNLSYNLYLLPFSFIAWLLSFLEFTFRYYYEGSYNHLMSLIVVNIIEPNNVLNGKNVIETTPSNLNYTLTARATELGFTSEDFPQLEREYFLCCSLELIFSKIKILQHFFFGFNFLIRFFLYLQISFFFFENTSLGFFSALKKSIIPSTRLYAGQRSHYEARRVIPKHQSDVEKLTNNNYKKGHLIIVETSESTSTHDSYKGSPTHGSGGHDSNASKEIHPSKSVDGQEGRPQNMTFPKEGSCKIPKYMINQTSEPGSDVYFKSSPVVENIRKHSGNSNANEDNMYLYIRQGYGDNHVKQRVGWRKEGL